MSPIKYSLATIAILSTIHAQDVSLDTLSVTATKIKTGTKDVSQSIAVVDEKTIEDKNILNIQEAIENIPGVNAESSTNSPSPRLIIRGAGLKARYGVREIMVMKDGVPMTDPDSFTRFDFIDMQDVSSVEVQKGPGSINAVNATGGVIQLVTKSVFEDDKNRIKLGIGDDGQQNINLKYRQKLSDNDFTSVTFSSRAVDNEWRDNNDFDSTQFTLKYGHIFEDDSTLETELSYTESNMNLPSSMTADEFAVFKDSGKQYDTSSQWQHSARDSKIFSFNARYEKEVGDFLFKPMFYFNSWEHFHPVTGMINDSDDNNVYGTDLELNYNHKLFSNDAVLVAGLTYKLDRTKGSEKYLYADLDTATTTSGWGPSATTVTSIVSTLSKNKGDLAQTEDSKTTLYGGYLMETFSPTKDITVDLSTRVDKLKFDVSGNEIIDYDYSSKSYATGVGVYSLDQEYTLFSAKLGAVYKITDFTNAYISIATANQAPTTSELISAKLDNGISLDKSKSVNFEIGLKTRAQNVSYDIAVYQNDVDDEIIQIQDANGNSIYDNAGKTKKRGLEFNIVYSLLGSLDLGANYAYSDFKFESFNESVRGSLVSRSGNYLPYIPKNQYSFFASYRNTNGFKARVTTKSWGSYYMDNANTEKYEGYDFVTDLMLGYERGDHLIQLNIRNIFNDYYAMQATKDVYNNKAYKAAAPVNGMLTYSYKF